MAEKKTPAAEVAEQNDASVEHAATDASGTTAKPATNGTGATPRFGRGILIGAAAAALIVGVALGGVGGFALAASLHHPHPLAGNVQQGPGGGQPPQGGGPGGGQGGPEQGSSQNGGPQNDPQQNGPQQNGPHGNGQPGGGPNQPGQNQNDDTQQDGTDEG
jgi:hypothetical protein